jgi:polar amino acid transport system ATP-binding protein
MADLPDRPIVELRNVNARLGGVHVLRDVNLSVRQGETVAIIGPSGSGKTTLLRCINFLVPYESGQILLRDELIGYREAGGGLKRLSEREVGKQRARIGFVFQHFNLFPHRTVLGNLLEGPVYVMKQDSNAVRERALIALQQVGLSDKADQYPDQLSGGQQQRVAIARALCMQPELMLLDEVTSALDPELVGEVLAVMRKVSDDGMTMVVVTHELRFARRCADRVIFMEKGEVIADMKTDDFFSRPPSERIAAYISDFRHDTAAAN